MNKRFEVQINKCLCKSDPCICDRFAVYDHTKQKVISTGYNQMIADYVAEQLNEKAKQKNQNK